VGVASWAVFEGSPAGVAALSAMVGVGSDSKLSTHIWAAQMAILIQERKLEVYDIQCFLRFISCIGTCCAALLRKVLMSGSHCPRLK